MSKVSVIIPVFNKKDTILSTLDSVYEQTYADYDIIVVDDASDDGTGALLELESENSRIIYRRLDVNSGVHVARNTGLDMASGEYIVLLDGDDQLFPYAIERAVKSFEGHSDVGLVSAPFKTDSGDLTGFDEAKSSYIPYERILCERKVRKYKNSFVMLRRSAIGTTRYVMQNLDFIFFRKIAKKTRMYYLADPLGRYVVNQPGALSAQRRKPDADLSIRRAHALADFLKEFGADLKEYCPEKIAAYAYGAAVGLLLDGRKKDAVHYATMAAKNSRSFRYKSFSVFSRLPLSSQVFRHFFVKGKNLIDSFGR